MLLGSYDQEQHRGIARAASEYGWHLDISLLKTFKLPGRWRGDGIICSLNNNDRLAQFVIEAGLPSVDLSMWRKDVPLPRVAADNRAIGSLAAEHFLEYGHRHFRWFALGRNPVGQARWLGFRERLGEEGLKVTQLAGKQTEDPMEVERLLVKLDNPTAIFTQSDLDAAWLLNVCLQAGLNVPEEIAILGVDNNTLICENQPVPLSSINHDLEGVGYAGACLLNALMSGKKTAEPSLISPNGVTTRESTDALAVADPMVRKALGYMEDNIQRSFSVSEIASALHLSRRQLEYRFRAALNKGVHQKCLEIRVKKVENLLKQTQESVEEITAMTGFANAPHLSRVFKEVYGMPPHRYRKANSSSFTSPS